MGDKRAVDRGATVLDVKVADRKKNPRFPRVWFDDALVETESTYCVKGVIDMGRTAVVYGPSGSGKTFWTGDLACHVSTGIQWRGKRVRPGLVIYVAAEAGASILRRFYAWRESRLGEAREGRIPMTIITRSANLLNSVEVLALIAELKAISAEVGMPVALVVFDTLSRSIPGGDENHSEDMSRVVAVADIIRDDLGAGTLIVHHTGKDQAKGARGHSSLFAAADTVISVADRVATIEKVRDGVAGESFPFELDIVNLGEDADGDPITTCVVRHLSEAPPKLVQRNLSGVAKVALQALQEAIAEHGRSMPGTSSIPKGVMAVTLDQWRTRFRLRYGTDHDGDSRSTGTVRIAFLRARDQLARVDAITISDPFVWPR